MKRDLCLGMVFLVILILLSIQAAWASEGYQPSSTERVLWALAEQEQADLEQRWSTLVYPDTDRYIAAIVRQLWDQVQTDLPQMRVRLLVNSAADAFAYPNGICYITSGMLLQTASRDQLAMVLAHEIIHYTRRHTLAAYDAGPIDGRPDLKPMAEMMTRRDASFSQAEVEEQADREGFQLLVQSGFCPDEALSLPETAQMPDGLPATHRLAGLGFNSQGGGRFDNLRRLVNQDIRVTPCGIAPAHIQAFTAAIAPSFIANARHALKTGRWELARESIARYLAACPTDPKGHFVRGEILRLEDIQSDRSASEAAYLRAVELDASFVPAYEALGILYLKKGQKDKARPYFEYCLAHASQGVNGAYIQRYLQLCQK